MQNSYKLPVVGMLIALLFTFGCSGSRAPEKDQAGKTPVDYVDAYFEAVNTGDYVTLKALHTKGYYEQFSSRSDDPAGVSKRFQEWFEKEKTTSHTILPKQCAFFKANAPGVYSVSTSTVRTEEVATKLMKQLNASAPMYKGGPELCFRLENGLWRLTDKTTGK
jgi:hypothetical protein